MLAYIHILSAYRNVNRTGGLGGQLLEEQFDCEAILDPDFLNSLFELTQNTIINANYAWLEHFCVQFLKQSKGFTSTFVTFVKIAGNIAADCAFTFLPALPLLLHYLRKWYFRCVHNYVHEMLGRYLIRLACNLLIVREYSEPVFEFCCYIGEFVVPALLEVACEQPASFYVYCRPFIMHYLNVCAPHAVEYLALSYFEHFCYDEELAAVFIENIDIDAYITLMSAQNTVSRATLYFIYELGMVMKARLPQLQQLIEHFTTAIVER